MNPQVLHRIQSQNLFIKNKYLITVGAVSTVRTKFQKQLKDAT